MRKLERVYSKTDRIVAKAKFTYWVFAGEVITTLILGGIIACLWIFGLKIEQLIDGSITEVRYLTETNLKWAILGAGGFMLLVTFFHILAVYSKEVILTEDKLVYRAGMLGAEVITLQVYEIVNTRVTQGAFQRLLGIGSVEIIGSGFDSYTIKNIVGPDKFARRVMAQATAMKKRYY